MMVKAKSLGVACPSAAAATATNSALEFLVPLLLR